MVSAHPVVDPILWLRTLVGIALILGLPGWLLLARHIRTDPLTRTIFALGSGLLIAATSASVAAFTRLPWNAWAFAVLTPAAGWGLGRWPAFVSAVQRLWSEAQPAPRWMWGTLTAICAAVLVGLIIGFAGVPAPPHLFDTSNHAFLIQRVADTASTAPSALFGPPYGAPDLPYLVGWHAALALVAQIGGTAPYLAMWLTVLLIVALLPASLAWLWRIWGLPFAGVLIAASVLAAGHYAPVGILGWGGFGVLVANFLVPPLVVGLRNWTLDPGSIGAGLLGLGLGALLHIHASEIPWVLALTLICWAQDRTWPAWRAWPTRLPWMLLGFVLIGPAAILQVLPAYLSSSELDVAPLMPAGKVLEDVVHAAGRWELLRALWPLALLLGWTKRSRGVAIGAIVVTALAVGVGAFGDPVSALCATPFYRKVPRVLYLLMFLIGPLIGWLALRFADRLPLHARRSVLALLGAVVLLPAQPELQRLYRNMHRNVPFTASDVEHARRIPSVVDANEWVANVHNDGSTWAMLVSGRRFLIPTRWGLGEDPAAHLDAILGLLRRPWPAETTALAARGVAFVYASRTRIPDDRVDARMADFTVDSFDRDPRFEPRLVSADAVLYAIDWSLQP